MEGNVNKGKCRGDTFTLIYDLCIFYRKLDLPAIYEAYSEQLHIPTSASTSLTRISIDLPKTSVAGVKGTEADKFEAYQDEHLCVVPCSHAWLPSGDIIVGCKGGQLLRVSYSLKLFKEMIIHSFFFMAKYEPFGWSNLICLLLDFSLDFSLIALRRSSS